MRVRSSSLQGPPRTEEPGGRAGGRSSAGLETVDRGTTWRLRVRRQDWGLAGNICGKSPAVTGCNTRGQRENSESTERLLSCCH